MFHKWIICLRHLLQVYSIVLHSVTQKITHAISLASTPMEDKLMVKYLHNVPYFIIFRTKLSVTSKQNKQSFRMLSGVTRCTHYRFT